MKKKAQIGAILTPKSLVFIFGGAILGYMLFKSIEAAIIGAIIGGLISFIR